MIQVIFAIQRNTQWTLLGISLTRTYRHKPVIPTQLTHRHTTTTTSTTDIAAQELLNLNFKTDCRSQMKAFCADLAFRLTFFRVLYSSAQVRLNVREHFLIFLSFLILIVHQSFVQPSYMCLVILILNLFHRKTFYTFRYRFRQVYLVKQDLAA